jgi:hypothetical protein
MNEKITSFVDVLTELDAGTFEQKISRAMAECAFGVVETGKTGKIVITLDLKRIATSNQVTVKHALKFVRPTENGKVTEENATETPLYVGARGRLTVTPDTQQEMFGKRGSETTSSG